MSDSLWPHRLQHARLLYPPLSPRVCSDSCPLSLWCYLTISSSAAPFSFCPQSFLASGSFPMSRLLASGGQSIGASASASVFSMNIQDWFPLEFIGEKKHYVAFLNSNSTGCSQQEIQFTFRVPKSNVPLY